MSEPRIEIPREAIAAFCRRNRIRRLSFFGSILRDDFGPDSDIDVLVEFEPGQVPGLLRMAGLEIELSGILGRKADLRTAAELSRHFREEVLKEAQTQYDAALVAIENTDMETVALSTNPRFMALIERSRTRQKAEGGISSAELRRRLGF